MHVPLDAPMMQAQRQTWSAPAGIAAAALASGTARDRRPDQIFSAAPSVENFEALRVAYRSNGGIVRADELARALQHKQRGDFVGLARNIASGLILGFEWQGSFWIPLFQFERMELSLNQGARQVLAELAGVIDGWALAVWFVQPSSWLRGQLPLNLLRCNLQSVLAAARADRFVADG